MSVTHELVEAQKIDIVSETDGVVNEWIAKWKKNGLSHCDIQSYWRTRILQVEYDPISMRSKYEEGFISTLEKFIFYGESPDYIEVVLRENEKSTSCCKVFNENECFYTCEDCKMTENEFCGLCVECFNRSAHIKHRYKLRVCKDNEICGCGQKETWKSESGCSKHSMFEKSIDIFPKDLESRAAIVIEAILRYNAVLMDGEEYVPEDNCWDRNSYCTLLYNLDSDLLSIFKQASLDGDVLRHVQNLEEDGVTIYRYGSKEYCEDVPFESLNEVFQVSIIHSHEVLRQNFAVKLLQYLEKFLKYGKEFRKIFSELLKIPLSLQESFLEKYFIKPSNLSLKFRLCCFKLLVGGTLEEYENKKMVAKEIVKMYGKYSKQFVLRSPEFLQFTPHLFFDASLSDYLIEEDSALTVVCDSILGDSETSHNMWELKLKENTDGAYECFYQTLCNVRMLLSGKPKRWSTKVRKEFLDGLSCFLQILSKTHKMKSHVRKTAEYVQDDPELFSTIAMQTDLGEFGSHFLKWCSDDKEVLMEAFNATLVTLQNNFPEDFNQEIKIISWVNHNATCLPYESDTQSVSFCLPLTRFLTGLTLCLEKYGVTLKSMEVDSLKSILVPLIDSVLKMQVMMAQEAAGMWKLNGVSFPQAIVEYRKLVFRRDILDRDNQILQIAASIMNPNEFVITVLHKYGLLSWVESNFEENLKMSDEEKAEMICVAEHFLQLMINVVAERYIPEIGHVTIKDCAKHEIIHRLCIKPRTHSKLENCFTASVLKEIGLDDIVNEVAIFNNSEDGLYWLKESFYDQYNPLFYHYTPEQISEAQEFQRECRKAAKKPEVLHPPKLPKLKPSFSSMVHIFQSDILLHIIKVILERSIDLNSKSYSDGQLQKVLYLIGFALLDEESGYYGFLSFADKTAKWKIFELLEKLLTSTRSDLPKGLIIWTLRKYNTMAGGFNYTTNVEFEESEESLAIKKKLVAERRAKIMQEITQDSNQFMENNFIIDEMADTQTTSRKVCLLCQDTQSLGLQNKAIIVLGIIQNSSVLWKKRKNLSEIIDSPLLSSDLGPAYFTSTCGHAMHVDCWERYVQKSWNHSKNCPLCDCPSNMVLPLFPSWRQFQENLDIDTDLKELTITFTSSFQESGCENPLKMWKSFAYTIHAIETSMRDLNQPLLEHFSSRNQASLESFVRVAAAASVIYPREGLFKFYITQIEFLLAGETSNLGTILDLDMFGLLVVMKLTKSDLFGLLSLVFVGELTKILICSDFKEMKDENNQDDFHQQSPIKQILKMVSKGVHHLSDDFIWSYLQKASVPFLRCCVLFDKFLNETPSPVELMQLGGDSFPNLCSYLELPKTREEIFGDQQNFSIIKKWCTQPSVVDSLKSGSEIFSISIPQLIKLPNEYSELVTKIFSLRHDNGSNKFGTSYKLCLVCGGVVCSGSCCMELGINNTISPGYFCHKTKCGGIGLFLSLHECSIMAVFGPDDAILKMPAPYVNEFNENYSSKSWVRNGYRLKYSPKMYKKLHNEWLGHSILHKTDF